MNKLLANYFQALFVHSKKIQNPKTFLARFLHQRKILKRQQDTNYSSKSEEIQHEGYWKNTSILWKADSIFFVNCSRTKILIIFWRKNYQTALFSPLADFLTIIDPTSREVTEIFPNMRNRLVPSFFLIDQSTGQTSVYIYCLQIMTTP